MKKHDVADLSLASEGKRLIEWADNEMPVLRFIRKTFERTKPFRGMRISACLHVTTETANLMRTLKAGGAEVFLCAANPLSTQDAVAAGMVRHYGIHVFARRGEDKKTYYRHIMWNLDAHPHVTLDDGGDQVHALHTKRKDVLSGVYGSSEETTTGVIRLKSMEQEGALQIPVIAVNSSRTKHLFDNRYGTGQSTIDGILRATNILFSGKVVVVAGYGWCGRGVAMRARGMGARVIVAEVDPMRALEAVMDGFAVMPMRKAAREGDVFITVTGNRDVFRKEHFRSMKDGAMLCNAGHFNVEINMKELASLARSKRRVRELVDEYHLSNGKRIRVLGEGRIINLVAAEGHPASVMDMSFANQALAAEYIAKKKGKLEPKVHTLPQEIDERIARMKLKTMGIRTDVLTQGQKKYLASWREGT